MNKLFLYHKLGVNFSSHLFHPIQPCTIVFHVRKQGKDWAMYGKQGVVKRIMLNDSQVIPLKDYFSDLASPTKQEIDLFNMLYNVDIESALNDYNQCSSLLEEDS